MNRVMPLSRMPLLKQKVLCDWCGSDKRVPITGLLRDEESMKFLPNAFKEERYQFARCENCNLAYLPLRPHPDDLPLYYSSEYCCFQNFNERGSIINSLAEMLAKLKLYQIRKYMPKNQGVLLDYGCGSGTWLRMLKRLKLPWKIIGADIAAEAIQRLTQNAIEAYICDDTNVFNFIPKESVDVIHLFHVIEHVPSPTHLLKTLFELLVPGGVIIGQTPNVAALERQVWRDSWTSWHVPRHFVLFDPGTLKRHAEKAGFKIEMIKNSLTAATQWASSCTKKIALKKGRTFKGIHEPLYHPLILLSIPLTIFQLLFHIQTSNIDFIIRKP